MKHYKFIALLISACMAFSCTGMLDEDPTHRGTAETFYSTPDGLNAAVIACYSSLRLVHKDKTLYMTGLFPILPAELSVPILYSLLSMNTDRI